MSGNLILQLGIMIAVTFFGIEKGHAACTSPAAQSGAIEYFSGTNQYKICVNTAWETIDISTSELGECTKAQGRKIDFGHNTLKICDGSRYKRVNCVAGSGIPSKNHCFQAREKKLRAWDATVSNSFGQAVAVSSSGDTLLVGGNGDAAYIFTRSGAVWNQQQKLTTPGGSYFGYSVALSSAGDVALIASIGEDNLAGAAYVFTRTGSTWSQQARLVASDRANFDYFGDSVALNSTGDTAIVGADRDDSGASTDAGAAYVFTRSGSTWTQQQKLTASDFAATDYFGERVALSNSGDIALIGAMAKNSGPNTYAGAAYVFTRTGTTWTQQQKLTASDLAANDRFGSSVALSSAGDTALIGAKGKATSVGAAYVFTRSGSTWTQQQKLTAPTTVINDQFGVAAALSSTADRALIGATGTASAYIFTRSGTTWTQQEKLTVSDANLAASVGSEVAFTSLGDMAVIGVEGYTGVVGSASVFTGLVSASFAGLDTGPQDNFGASAAFSNDGNTMIIGATGDVINAGSAYVFIRSGSTWVQQQKLTSSDTASSDFFGYSVSISASGDMALVGAYNKVSGTGAAYVFTRSGATWTQQQKLTASDAATGDYFGRSVALSSSGDIALIGASAKSSYTGAVYVYSRSGSTWTQQQKLTASDAAGGDYFGESVALSGSDDIAMIGAFQKNSSAGAVYVFTRSASIWNEQQKLAASDAASGDRFGNFISLSGTGSTALIGAYTKSSLMGAAYVFIRSGSTWIQQQKIVAPDLGGSDYFGNSVSLSSAGDMALIGAYNHMSNVGAAYLYTVSGSTWIQQQKLTAFDAAAGDRFGHSVALSRAGDRVLVGAYTKNVGAAIGVGAVYSYDLSYWTECSNSIVESRGTAALKSQASPWTARTNIYLRPNDTLLVCASTLGTLTGVTWNGNSMTLNSSNAAGTAKVGIYSYRAASEGTGNIAISTTASATSAVSAIVVSGLDVNPFDVQSSSNGSSDSPNSGGAATTQADEFLFGCVGVNGPVEDSGGQWQSPLGSDQRNGTTGSGANSNLTVSSGYAVVSSTDTYQAYKYPITSRNWAAALATYKMSVPPTCQSYGACSRKGSVDFSAGNGLRICDGANWRQIKTVP